MGVVEYSDPEKRFSGIGFLGFIPHQKNGLLNRLSCPSLNLNLKSEDANSYHFLTPRWRNGTDSCAIADVSFNVYKKSVGITNNWFCRRLGIKLFDEPYHPLVLLVYSPNRVVRNATLEKILISRKEQLKIKTANPAEKGIIELEKNLRTFCEERYEVNQSSPTPQNQEPQARPLAQLVH